jgi:uncharacterized membrane protein YedE/YeeE
MRAALPAFVSGVVFGGGLAISDMVNPARVLGFLDIAGVWDPTLVFVMAAAVAASAVGYIGSRRLRKPLFGKSFFLPENRLLDRRLIAGAALFGIGWGLVGFCPGPAIAGLAYGKWETGLFVVAMVAGMWLHRLYAGLHDRRLSGKKATAA